MGPKPLKEMKGKKEAIKLVSTIPFLERPPTVYVTFLESYFTLKNKPKPTDGPPHKSPRAYHFIFLVLHFGIHSTGNTQ